MFPKIHGGGLALLEDIGSPRLPNTLGGGIWTPKTYPKDGIWKTRD